jgi:hypothetical protein
MAATMTERDARRLSVLMVFTRDPRGAVTGRKLVLGTIVGSVVDLGCSATVAYFGPPEGPAIEAEVRYEPLDRPTPAELAAGALGWLLRGRPSLNEALYCSRRARDRLAALAEALEADLVVTDMVRTASYGAASGRPWIADLDDLLSRRYAAAARAGGDLSNLLGYHKSGILRLALAILSPFGAALLRREASVIAEREIAVARAADVATLVSATEAATLAEAAGAPVRCTPMAVAEPKAPAKRQASGKGLVFVGPMGYAPNFEAVRRYASDVAPALRTRGVRDVALHVIGAADESVRRSLPREIVFLGYVEDLDAALCDFEAMLVPQVAPGGVKTKIIHAAMNRLPVLAHASAVDGSGLRDGRDVLVWRDADELGAALGSLRDGRIDRDALTKGALAWARENFGRAEIRRRWAENISAALQAGGERTARRAAAGTVAP